MIATAPCYSV